MRRLTKKDLDLSSARRALLEQLAREEGLRSQSHDKISRRAERTTAPLSLAQQRLWFINELDPGNPVYMDHFAVRVTGAVNVVALKQSVDEVVRRHEALRTTFGVRDDRPIQIIDPTPFQMLPVSDLEGLSQAARKSRSRRLAIDEARRPFDLARGPLFRIALSQLGEYESLLLFTVHHIISDGWSLGVFIGQLSAVYAAYCVGKGSPFPEMRIQYGDYAQWQQERIAAALVGPHISFWKEKMTGAPLVLELPADRPRPPVRTFNGSRRFSNLTGPLSDSLRSLSQQQGVTLFMLLLAAFKVLLHRYSGQRDLIVGTPVAGRELEELKELFGCFANVVILRTTLSSEIGFTELLSRVKKTSVEAYEHQDLPFEKLVESLQPERDLSRTPLFQVMFVLQGYPIPRDFGGLKLDLINVDNGTSKFDLMLEVFDRPEGLGVAVEYSTDLYEQETIARLITHFENLLQGIVADPRQRVGDLPLLSEEEIQEIALRWNDLRADYPRLRCVHELFEDVVEGRPDAIALVSAERRLSYGELNRRANRLAHYLRQRGVVPEALVPICIDRSPEMIVGMLGILKSGGAYVPLDPTYPQQRLAFMLEDARADLLLTQKRLLRLLPESEASPICLDGDWGCKVEQPEENPRRPVCSDNVAYIIYTSGSTGRPKGVAIRHSSAVAMICWAEQIYSRDELAGVLASTSICFDLSVFEIFVPLSRGGAVILAENALELPRIEAREEVTLINTVPSAMAELARQGSIPKASKTVNLAGEALQNKLVQRVYEHGWIERVVNLYGPSEDTTYSTYEEMKRGTSDPPLIGRPIANTQAYILDGRLGLAPRGVAGELCLAGDGLARGYVRRGDVTAEKFIPNPFGEAGARLYRTGDLARYRPGARIEYLGRADRQVKIRGYRIELGEIEEAMGEVEWVREAAVVVREGSEGEKRLVGYVVLEEGVGREKELRSRLKQKLPDYMVPGVVIVLDRMPLTPNGKIDRLALPKHDNRVEGTGYVAPRNPVEEVLCNIWGHVLAVSQVGIQDDFFELGGHSLLATQVVSRVRSLLGVEASLRGLLTNPTVAGMAAEVEARRSGAQDGPPPDFAAADRRDALPLSFAQQRLWFIDRMEPGSSAYNIPCGVRIKGMLSPDALQSSLNEIVRRHEVLRTTFQARDGSPVQHIDDLVEAELRLIDLSANDAKEEWAGRLAREEAGRSFDIARGPLIRAALLQVSGDEHVLLVTMHHLVSDGWSIGVIVRELSQLYEAVRAGAASPLSELKLQYADYAVWQRKWLQGPVLEGQLDYWKRQLAEAPVVELPSDGPRLPAVGRRGAEERFRLSHELNLRLKDLGRREGLTPFMTLLAAYQVLLARFSGQQDVAVGTPISGRNREEIEGLIGFFANTLVIRTNVSGDPTAAEMLQRTRKAALTAFEHQDLPFEKLVEELSPERSLSRNPLFQVMFAFQSAPRESLAIRGLSVSLEPIFADQAKFDLSLFCEEEGGETHGSLVYARERYEPSTIKRINGHLTRLLEGMVSNPDWRVMEIPLLSEAERQQVAVEWNAVSSGHRDAKRHLCEMLEKKTRGARDAIAAPIGDGVTTAIHIVDDRGEPTPVGVVGEILIEVGRPAGECLQEAHGAAERAAPGALSSQGMRRSRTGNLGRWLADGDIELIGPIDRQVNIRGHRVQLAEVESVLARHPGVSRCAVCAREDGGGRRRLVAYVSPAGEDWTGTAGLRTYLRNRLPDYMTPSAFVEVARFPLTQDGVLDLDALPLPDVIKQEETESASGPVEEIVAGIWAEVLGLETVGVTQKFFELGGHSLLATQVISRVADALGTEVPVRALFDSPTVSGLAQAVEMARGRQVKAPPVRPVGRDREVPLSFAQQRLWFIDQLERNSSAYNIPGAMRLRGLLGVAALYQGLDEIARRHETLRTRFEMRDGRTVQVVGEKSGFELPVWDISGLETEHDRLLAEIAGRQSHRSFDLERGPVWRAALVREGADEHVLLLCMHHIVSDGWSVGVLTRELAALYESYRSGQRSELPEPPAQYADYAVWQRSWLQGDDLEDQVDYWRRRLTGASVLELPTDSARPATPTRRGAEVLLTLPADLIRQLKQLSRREGVTPFITLLSAFQLLLGRHSGQDDITVGTPIANRNRLEIEGLIGFFVNTLAIRTDLSRDPTFIELLKEVREAALDAHAHQHIPFEKLVEELQPRRDLSRNPLFDVMFNLLDFADSGNRTIPAGLAVESLSLPDLDSKFDLTLYAESRESGILLRLVYSTDLFERPRMVELLEQYSHLLSQIALRPDQRIGCYSLVTTTAANLLPDAALEIGCSWTAPVHYRFSRLSQVISDRLAVSDLHDAWSYGELDDESNRLANYLIARGVDKHDLVAIYGHRSAYLVLALLGVLKAGAAFLILDPKHPAARTIDCLETAAPRAWLQLEAAGRPPKLLEEYLSNKAWSCRATIGPQEIKRLLSSYSERCPNAGIEPDDIAYVAFTSGSTGTPKGIVGTHRPLSHFFQWHSATFKLNEEDRFSMLSGLAHDPLLRDIFSPLWAGASLRIPGPAELDGERLFAWMREEGITVAHLTPAMGRLIYDSRSSGSSEKKLEELRYVFFGGDLLRRRDIVRMREMAPNAQCVNFYGATETPQGMGYYVTPAYQVDSEPQAPVPIGHGIEGAQLLVINASEQPAGVGELGEINIRTGYLARGYLNDDREQQRRFISSPESAETQVRIYKTGDMGRYLSNGEVVFAGRTDDQVKLRGYRIELGEIETVLAECAGVKQAVVAVVPEEERLIAYLLPEDDRKPSESRIRGYLSERLPDYMAPSAFIAIDKVPLTPNGKIDRRALPVQDPRAGTHHDVDNARTPFEEIIAGIWEELLRRDGVGMQDNFFELGGHSLLAARLVSRIRAAFDAELAVRVIFESPTVAGQAQAVERELQSGARMSPPIEAVSRDAELPLSFAQQRLWFVQRLEPESVAYNLPHALRLEGPLNVAAVSQSLQEIERRHEVLRTRFETRVWRPVQLIDGPGSIDLPLFDVSGLCERERERLARELAEQDSVRPFDLERGPVWRSALARLDSEVHVLLVSMHHIASDAWSTGVLANEFTSLYDAFQAGLRSPIPDLPLQYPDFAVWQRQWLREEALDERMTYWRAQLAGAPPLKVPVDRARPNGLSRRGGNVPVRLSAELSDDLKKLSRREGITLFMALLAGYQIALGRYAGQEDVVVGTDVASRPRLETEGLIGFFVNELVLRTDLSGYPSFGEVLARVRETTLGAYAHQDVPFEKLVEQLSPERHLSRSPLFQVKLVLQNAPKAELRIGRVGISTLEVQNRTAKFDFTLFLTEGDEGVRGHVEYAAELFEEVTMRRLVKHLEVVLERMAADVRMRIGETGVLSEWERHQVTMEWNDTAGGWGECESLADMVERQVEKRGEAIAVKSEEAQLSYGEMNRRAEDVARRLCEMGIREGSQVAVCVERSPEMVIGMLGVLKAGGAYVPIDPEYPTERVGYMAEDCGAAAVLTSGPLLERLRSYAGPVISLDAASENSEESGGRGRVGVSKEDLAYVIYTSGSTGRPKGAMNTVGGIANRLKWMQDEYDLRLGERVLQKTTMSFDVSVWEIFWPLVAGGMVVMARPGGQGDAKYVRELAMRDRISVMHFVPSMLESFLGEGGWRGCETVRLVISSGEALSGKLAERFYREGGRRLENLYGPTEAAVDVTYRRCKEDEGGVTVPIGRGIGNTRVYVFDRYGEPAGLGVPGELHIGGVAVGRGYWRRADLTGDRYVPDGLSGEEGGRLYRTGDIVKWGAEGELEYLGRVDDQVKVRGYRIELGEIEAALNEYPRVEQGVVLLKQDKEGGPRLTGYVVANGSEPLSVSDLRQHLNRVLPAYMVPTAFVELKQLPLTANGKTDRHLLSSYEGPQMKLEVAYIAPHTNAEHAIASVWREVLSLQEIGIHENFFDIGGHSLLLIRVQAKLHEKFENKVTLIDLFKYPTIKSLALHLGRERGELSSFRHSYDRAERRKERTRPRPKREQLQRSERIHSDQLRRD